MHSSTPLLWPQLLQQSTPLLWPQILLQLIPPAFAAVDSSAADLASAALSQLLCQLLLQSTPLLLPQLLLQMFTNLTVSQIFTVSPQRF